MKTDANIKEIVKNTGVQMPAFSRKDSSISIDNQVALMRATCDKILDIVAVKINIVKGKPLGFHVRSAKSGYSCGTITEYYDFGRIVSAYGVDRDGGVDNSITIIFDGAEDQYIKNKKDFSLESYHDLGRECVAEKLRYGRYK